MEYLAQIYCPLRGGYTLIAFGSLIIYQDPARFNRCIQSSFKSKIYNSIQTLIASYITNGFCSACLNWSSAAGSRAPRPIEIMLRAGQHPGERMEPFHLLAGSWNADEAHWLFKLAASDSLVLHNKLFRQRYHPTGITKGRCPLI